ncbi:MAG: peptidoglycan-binding protein [Acidimicrobiia bacterium]|nr:peptidoglycan-binding protein [Acidimicrobiia bacterium]
MSAPVLPLARGAAGEAVRDLQRRLARAGYDLTGDEPGAFGEHTASAVSRFQEARGLRADDVCGTQTWNALVEAGYGLGDRLLYERRPMLRGDDVAELQTRLGDLGFFADRVDGILGPQTAAAITDFQRNTGLTADGICGPDTIASLNRVQRRTPPAVKAGVVERERLRTGPRRLDGRRIVVGQLGGLDALASTVGRFLQDQGAVVVTCTQPEPSAQATEANDFDADVYLGLDLSDDPGCRCSYYGRPDYESTGGRRLAERLAESLPGALDAPRGTARRMQLPVLRETRMVAVWCEVGPPARVVEATAAIGRAVVRGFVDWAAAPVEG